MGAAPQGKNNQPWRIAPEWRGEPCVILCTGPSLDQTDVDYVRGKAHVIAVNDAYRVAPWADILYATDSTWWTFHKASIGQFSGRMVCCEPTVFRDVQYIHYSGHTGFDDNPGAIRTGKNSGFAALHIAAHLGANPIIYLGLDMQGDHFFGAHPKGLGNSSPYSEFIKVFDDVAPLLVERGIRVINCSRNTVLTSFPRKELRNVI